MPLMQRLFLRSPRLPLRGPRLLLLFALAALAGCGATRLWPFGEEAPAQAAAPENATHYRCAAGKAFYLRMLADGDAWVILPDRQARLAKGPGSRFAAGTTVLELAASDADTTLADGPNNPYTGCRLAKRE
jgi:hypothetical protein